VAPRSIYRVTPAVDVSIIAAGVLANRAAVRLRERSSSIPAAPANPGEVNSLDRHVIGNHNKVLDDASDATLAIAS